MASTRAPFAADVAPVKARVMHATQQPLSGSTFGVAMVSHPQETADLIKAAAEKLGS